MPAAAAAATATAALLGMRGWRQARHRHRRGVDGRVVGRVGVALALEPRVRLARFELDLHALIFELRHLPARVHAGHCARADSAEKTTGRARQPWRPLWGAGAPREAAGQAGGF